MRETPTGPDRERAAAALLRAGGALSTAATSRMESEHAWFRDLSAEDRSWVGLIVQAGVRQFVEWYGDRTAGPLPDGRGTPADHAIAAQVFGAAPRALAGVITLRQTVDLVRLTVEVVEGSVEEVVHPDDVADVRAAALSYAREVAFATAEVYARAAEVRGAWDARLEALVVDAVLRAEADEAVLSRAGALGWAGRSGVCAVLGSLPHDRDEADLFEDVRRAARDAGADALCATQGDRLVVLLGGVDDEAAAEALTDLFGPGPVVVGPLAADLGSAHASARSALSAHRAAAGWPTAPRPVAADALLAERALAGDGHARRHLVEDVYLPLAAGRGTLEQTLASYVDHGASVEGTARALFVHPNTVRYRLRQVADATGLRPGDPRDRFVLRVALVLGRLSGRRPDEAPAPPAAPGGATQEL